MELVANFETITPLQAQEIIDKNNIDNRRVDYNTVNKYARCMLSDDWLVNGQTIVFDKNGVLRDGQHRLMACTSSDTPFVTLVVRGVDPSCFKTLDDLRKRTLRDTFSIMQEENHNLLSGIVHYFAQYKTYNMVRESVNFSNIEGTNFLEKNPNVREVAEFISKNKKYLRELPPAVLGTLKCIFDEISVEDSNRYFNTLLHGVCDDINNPVKIFRDIVIRYKLTRKRNSRVRTPIWFFKGIKAWNFMRKGRSVSKIVIRENEKFPVAI